MDLSMPLKSGKECLSEIRSSNKYSNIPVVMLATNRRPNRYGVLQGKRCPKLF